MAEADYRLHLRKSYVEVIRGRTKYIIIALLLSLGAASVYAQTTDAQPEEPANAATDSRAEKPLPDIVTMMHEVEQNQRKAEAIEKDYIYHSAETQEHTDSEGRVKKTTVMEYDHYWSEGVPVRRLVR